MDISYRPARPEDLEAAMGVVAGAINDLRTRHGLVPNVQARAPVFQRDCLTRDPDGLWVAEAAGAVVGFGFSWVCQDFWYLAQLFIKPELQAGGVGQTLLDKALTLESRYRTSNRALITFPYNTAATGLYLKNGLYPRQPLCCMLAPAEHVRHQLVAAAYDTQPLQSEVPGWVGDLDAQVLGFRRDAHHRFQQSSAEARGIAIMQSGRPIGYAYIAGGHIGPLCISPDADGAQAVAAAVRAALADNPPQISMVVPGAATTVLAAVTAMGFRIEEPLMLLSARPFGDWRCYLPSNPGYL